MCVSFRARLSVNRSFNLQQTSPVLRAWTCSALCRARNWIRRVGSDEKGGHFCVIAHETMNVTTVLFGSNPSANRVLVGESAKP